MSAEDMMWDRPALKSSLLHGDCFTILPTLGKVDAIVTDPPLHIGGNMPGMAAHWTDAFETGNPHMRRLASLLLTKIKSGGVCVVFNDTRTIPATAEAFKAVGWEYRRMAIVSRLSGKPVEGWNIASDIALVFSLGPTMYYAAGFDDVLDAGGEPESDMVKPLGAVTGIVANVCPKGGIVLDPFMGSGTVGLACRNTGRGFIGIEQDLTWYDRAVARLRQESVAA